MRSCNECTKCCDGYLSGTVRGSWFGGLNPCKYLVNNCSIYKERPHQCSKYQCAWYQGLLLEWMKPSKIEVVVCVELDKAGKQFLKAVSPKELTQEVEDELTNFVTKNNTYLVKSKVIPIRTL